MAETKLEAAERSKTLRFLASKLWENKGWLLASGVFVLVAAGTQVYTSMLVKSFFDEALVPKDWHKVLLMCVLVVAMFFADGLSDFLHRFFIRISMERTVRKLRNQIFQRFLVMSPSQLNQQSSSKAVNAMTADIQVLGVGTHIVADLLREPIVFLALLGRLFYLNWQLTLVCFLAAPLIALIGKGLGRSARRNQSRLQHSLERISNHIIESMGGLRTAHAFNQTSQLQREFNTHTNEAYGYLIRLARTEEIVGPLTKWFTSLVGALLVGFGGWLVVNDQLSAGGLASFITAAGLLQQPLRQLNHVGVRLQQLAAAGHRIYEILHTDLDDIGKAQNGLLTGPPKSPRTSIKQAPGLSWKNLYFRYPSRANENLGIDRAWTLENINLQLEPGKRLALVGKSGSGKSTLTQLTLRFLDPVKGEVYLGSKAARDWDLRDYRDHFSYVSQEVFLFNRSIRENLSFAKPDASDAELYKAIEKAHILDFVKQLPSGLDTVLGERANTLSGGERQRIAIARAFLRDSPILILDEATSQLDSHSERAVQEAIEELMKERSVIVIAHRLATVREVHEIAVFENGMIIENGPPSHLLRDDEGAFARLWKSQGL